jgi:hypothetical protein
MKGRRKATPREADDRKPAAREIWPYVAAHGEEHDQGLADCPYDPHSCREAAVALWRERPGA